MQQKTKNILTIIIIAAITILTIMIVNSIPGYLKQPTSETIPLNAKFIIIFLIIDLILIGIPAWLNYRYIKDYTPVKSILFFVIFGAITGVLFGEGGNPIMLIPYTILILIYAFLYRKFTWWKVALTSYWAAIMIENVLNRSPLQSSTLMWIAFFIYPYFITKIWDNRQNLKILEIIKDLKYTIISSIILMALALYLSRANISPPLILFSMALPFIITIIYKFFKKKKWKNKKSSNKEQKQKSFSREIL